MDEVDDLSSYSCSDSVVVAEASPSSEEEEEEEDDIEAEEEDVAAADAEAEIGVEDMVVSVSSHPPGVTGDEICESETVDIDKDVSLSPENNPTEAIVKNLIALIQRGSLLLESPVSPGESCF